MAAAVQRRQRTSTLHRIYRINAAVAAGDRAQLATLATEPSGFVNNGVRRRVWARLVGVDLAAIRPLPDTPATHGDAHQVQVDVVRSGSHFEHRGAPYRKMVTELGLVVNAILTRHPELHYYQGFHDICAVLLNVLEDRATAAAIGEQLAARWLDKAMAPTLQPVLEQLGLIPALLQRSDKALFDFLERSGVPTYFALSWCITWFAHDVDAPAAQARIFDLCIAFPPPMILYLCTALVLKARDDLLEEPCEADQLHAILGRLGRSTWDTEAVIARAVELWHAYPPDSVRPLPNWVPAQTKRPPLPLPATSTVRAIAWPVAAAVLSASAVLIYNWLETAAM